MKSQWRSFKMFIRQIWEDDMLVAVSIAPLLVACLFRFVIPYVERLLCEYFDKTSILADYYLLLDMFLSLITPYMFCFASAMVMLTEYDENMTNYIAVTPIGKRGYLISRLAFPAAISFLASVVIMLWFTLTVWPFYMILITCLLTCVLSIAVSLFIFIFSHNRVEGLAVAKLSGLIMLGLPVPFFITSKVQYLFFVLPSFWIAKLCMDRYFLFLLPAILVSALWVCMLSKKFCRKLA